VIRMAIRGLDMTPLVGSVAWREFPAGNSSQGGVAAADHVGRSPCREPCDHRQRQPADDRPADRDAAPLRPTVAAYGPGEPPAPVPVARAAAADWAKARGPVAAEHASHGRYSPSDRQPLRPSASSPSETDNTPRTTTATTTTGTPITPAIKRAPVLRPAVALCSCHFFLGVRRPV
jgi:hypothetical protein